MKQEKGLSLCHKFKNGGQGKKQDSEKFLNPNITVQKKYRKIKLEAKIMKIPTTGLDFKGNKY